MHKPKQLTIENFNAELSMITENYLPSLTRDNLIVLINEHNNLVEVVNILVERASIEAEPRKLFVFEDE